MQKLKKAFPMLKIEMDYADEKKGENTGWNRIEEENRLPKVKVFKDYSKDACIHACKVWGEKGLISLERPAQIIHTKSKTFIILTMTKPLQKEIIDYV